MKLMKLMKLKFLIFFENIFKIIYIKIILVRFIFNNKFKRS